MQQMAHYDLNPEDSGGQWIARSTPTLNMILFFSLLTCTILFLVFAIVEETLTPFLFFCTLYGIGGSWVFIANRRESMARRDAVRIFTIVFFVSGAISCAIYLYYMKIYGVPYESGGTDDARFDMIAALVQSSSIHSYREAVDVVKESGTVSWQLYGNYAIAVGFIQKGIEWVGLTSHTMIPRILNGFILAGSSVILFKAARFCTKSREATNIAAYFYGLLPSVLFVAAHVYRDILVGFGITLALYGLLEFLSHRSQKNNLVKTSRRFWSSFCFFTGVAIIGIVRTGMIPLILLCLSVLVLLQIKAPWIRAFLIIMSGFILIVLINGPLATIFKLGTGFFEYYTEYRLGGSAEDGISRIIYTLPFAFSIPLRLLYASISPVPFPSGIVSENFRRVGTIIWYLSIPFLIKGMFEEKAERYSFKSLSRQTVLSFFFVFYFAVAIITMQSRQITMYAPPGAILISLGLERCKLNPRPYLWSMILIGVAFVFLYLFVKIL